ncbi:hypothetical protein E2C01_044588 [Portunus trituberculatus]|uniref:Uncharacterized protein n=1 Tax=Portunus trituberculatus TaxID=210409 RepID=A0A5B7G0U4_PORTR|nr:hypothetical protein [Portunus trituberculatus]
MWLSAGGESLCDLSAERNREIGGVVRAWLRRWSIYSVQSRILHRSALGRGTPSRSSITCTALALHHRPPPPQTPITKIEIQIVCCDRALRQRSLSICRVTIKIITFIRAERCYRGHNGCITNLFTAAQDSVVGGNELLGWYENWPLNALFVNTLPGCKYERGGVTSSSHEEAEAEAEAEVEVEVECAQMEV